MTAADDTPSGGTLDLSKLDPADFGMDFDKKRSVAGPSSSGGGSLGDVDPPLTSGRLEGAEAELKQKLSILDAYRLFCGKMEPQEGSAGRETMISCPLPGHEDVHPSASASTEKDEWHCHRCSIGGDVMDLSAIKRKGRLAKELSKEEYREVLELTLVEVGIDPNRFKGSAPSPGSTTSAAGSATGGDQAGAGSAGDGSSTQRSTQLTQEQADRLEQAKAARQVGLKIMTWKDALYEEDLDADPLWWRDSKILWSAGEPLLIAANPGAGKTTLAGNIAMSMLGLIGPAVLGFYTKLLPKDQSILYLSMDRPKQARRVLRRIRDSSGKSKAELQEVLDRNPWAEGRFKGVTDNPELLVNLCHAVDASIVVVDSAKDMFRNLSEEEGAAKLNDAAQMAIAEGIEVMFLHHFRKGGKLGDPDSVYGGYQVAAGMGSILQIEREPGSEVRRMAQAKSPMEEMREVEFRIAESGQLEVTFDHNLGGKKSAGKSPDSEPHTKGTKDDTAGVGKPAKRKKFVGAKDPAKDSHAKDVSNGQHTAQQDNEPKAGTAGSSGITAGSNGITGREGHNSKGTDSAPPSNGPQPAPQPAPQPSGSIEAEPEGDREPLSRMGDRRAAMRVWATAESTRPGGSKGVTVSSALEWFYENTGGEPDDGLAGSSRRHKDRKRTRSDLESFVKKNIAESIPPMSPGNPTNQVAVKETAYRFHV